MANFQSAEALKPDAAAVVTEAVIRAAERLEVPARLLAAVIGVSEASVSRMKRGEFLLQAGSKPFELGVLFVRLFRSLDAITGGDEAVAAAWLSNPNLALGGPPIDQVKTVSGLVDVISYLDTRRALI